MLLVPLASTVTAASSSSILSDPKTDEALDLIIESFEEENHHEVFNGVKRIVSDLDRLRNRTHQALLSLFNALSSKEEARIIWSDVNVSGWPKEVVFYYRSFWSESDCRALEKAMERGEISFALKSEAEKNLKPFSLNKKKALRARALAISELIFQSEQICWRGFKEECPDLHMTCLSVRDWKAYDCVSLEAALRVLEGKHGLKLVDECLEKEEEEESKGSESSSSEPLKQLQVRTHAALLREWQKTHQSSSIRWHEVNVIGWPREVLFYSVDLANRVECEMILDALARGEIRFEWKEYTLKFERKEYTLKLQRREDTHRLQNFSLSQRKALLEKALEISKRLSGAKRINWTLIKEHCPDLQLTACNPKRLSYDDCRRLEGALWLLKQKFGLHDIAMEFVVEATKEHQGSAEKENLKSLKAVVRALLLAKYRNLAPRERSIRWPLLAVHGWPEAVIFYSCDCWSVEDCSRILEAMPGIRFSFAAEPASPLQPEALKGLELAIKNFFARHFGTRERNWRLVKDRVPHFHLTHAVVSKWTSKDEEMFYIAVEVFEAGKAHKRAISEEEEEEEMATIHKKRRNK